MKKLIFIEGVSGVGKTTTAVKLCDALRTCGYSTIYHLEGDADNPVDFFNCAYLTKAEFSQLLKDYSSDRFALINNKVQGEDYILVRYGDHNITYFAPPLFNVLKSHEGFYKPVDPINIDKYTQVFTDCWRRFLSQSQSNVDFEIFDGSFLYHRTNDLIQNYDATDEMIAVHLKALLSAMSPYKPLVFYLSSKDVRAQLIQARESRGQATATDAQIDFEVERKSRQIQVLKLLPVQTCIIDVSEGWAKAIDEMMGMILEESL